MPKTVDKASKPRPANPKCGGCNHPFTFHPRNPSSHRRKCGAFGCACKNYQKAEASE